MDLVSLVQVQDLDDNTMTGTFETDVLIVGRTRRVFHRFKFIKIHQFQGGSLRAK
jgi:hypothetical protein